LLNKFYQIFYHAIFTDLDNYYSLNILTRKKDLSNNPLTFEDWCTLLTWCLQVMTSWHEYAVVTAYKHIEMSQQVAKARLQLNRGIVLLFEYLY